MTIRNLHDLFVHALERVFYFEVTTMRVLPHMQWRANSARLKSEFSVQAQEATYRFARLESVFHSVDEDMRCRRSLALDGILINAEAALETDNAEVVDRALVATGLAIEHDRINRYGALVSWARTMGHEEAVALLQRTLDEAWAVRTLLAGFFGERVPLGRNREAKATASTLPDILRPAMVLGTISLKERFVTRLAAEKVPQWLASES